MEVKKGLIVKSKAGRDSGGFFICVDVKEDFAYIVDGKNRPIERPKKKRLKHMIACEKAVELSSDLTNKQIKKALFSYNYADKIS